MQLLATWHAHKLNWEQIAELAVVVLYCSVLWYVERERWIWFGSGIQDIINRVLSGRTRSRTGFFFFLWTVNFRKYYNASKTGCTRLVIYVSSDYYISRQKSDCKDGVHKSLTQFLNRAVYSGCRDGVQKSDSVFYRHLVAIFQTLGYPLILQPYSIFLADICWKQRRCSSSSGRA